MSDELDVRGELVEYLRKLLGQYDEGLCTEGEVGANLMAKLVEPSVQRAANGEEGGYFSSYCGPGGPTIRAVIEIGPGKPAWFKPLPPYYIPERTWPDENEKVWGVFVFGFHADALMPPADSPKWDQPGGVGYKDISFPHLWRGTKVEAEALCNEMNRDPARRITGNTRVVRPIPQGV